MESTSPPLFFHMDQVWISSLNLSPSYIPACNSSEAYSSAKSKKHVIKGELKGI